LFAFFWSFPVPSKKARKSQLASDRILAATRSIFADEGYEHATIRCN
jgi:hypothetical protein